MMVVFYHGINPDDQFGHWTGLPELFFKIWLHGYLGVELFFVLSGFLITGILLRTKEDPHYFRNFYTRRVLRIVPAYLLLLVVLKATGMIGWRFLLACLLFVANMSHLVGAKLEFGPLWSLSVEEQFYVIWPLLLKRISARATLNLTLAICIICPIVRWIRLRHVHYSVLIFKTYYIADMLAYGALIAVCLFLGYLRPSNIRRVAAVWILAGLAGSAYLLSVDYPGNPLSPLMVALHRVPFTWVFVGLVMLAVARDSREFSNPLAALFKFLGYISYGLYLVHDFVFRIYDRLAVGTRWLPAPGVRWDAIALRTISGTVIAIALAYLSRRFFEQRFLDLKDRLAPRSTPIQSERPISAYSD
jgi:peptidoglycan/LPS O-acetylase OafA/YrhL